MIQFKKMHPDAIIPKIATKGDAGFDLYADESKNISWPDTERGAGGFGHTGR